MGYEPLIFGQILNLRSSQIWQAEIEHILNLVSTIREHLWSLSTKDINPIVCELYSCGLKRDSYDLVLCSPTKSIN